jgi:hypothetical protein
MDYKFVILLLVIIAVFLFLYKELDNIKNNIKSKFEELTDTTSVNLRNMRSKFQTDLGTCVSRIKTHNADFINQARKINLINAQPVTYVSGSNYYTETDSEKKQLLQYLSDVRQTVKPKESILYMSDASKKRKSSKQKSSDITNSNEKQQIIVEEIEIKQIDGLTESDKKSEKKDDEKINILKPVNDVNVSNLQDSSSNIPCRQVMSSNLLENILEETNENETDDDSSKTENIVIDVNQYINGDNDNLKKESEKSENDESSDSSSTASGASGYGEITFGSSKKETNGIVPKITIGKGHDSASISTVDAEHINLKTLKTLDTYTKKKLEKIAKVYSLPSTYKSHDGKRVQYKKEDLYQLIKNHLNTKNKNL